MAPHEPVSQYRHNDTGEDNADAPIKRQIMGREVVVVVTNGQLHFGTWEHIFYGQLNRRLGVCTRNMRGMNSTTLR